MILLFVVIVEVIIKLVKMAGVKSEVYLKRIFHPKKILNPKSTEEALSMVKEHLAAKKTIRMRGTGHSWTGLNATDDSFLHLDDMQGLIDVNATDVIACFLTAEGCIYPRRRNLQSSNFS